MPSRYVRQIAVPEIGKEGQQKLHSSSVLIIGCGALGSMVAMQLTGAGIGRLKICDFDTIDVTNLQRQFFFKTEEAGKNKSETLARKMSELNPEIEIEIDNRLITRKLASELIPHYDFVVDATDNPDSKRITGEVCKEKGKACCIAGVSDFSGQVTTFLPEDPRFEEYFGEVTYGGFLPCSMGGVMGPAVALCASIQANETIKYLTKAGETLSGKILLFNLLTNSFKTLSL